MPGPERSSRHRSWWLPVSAAILSGLIGAGATWWVMGGRLQLAEQHAHVLQQAVTRTQDELLGYSRYTSYLTLGKQTLAEHVLTH